MKKLIESIEEINESIKVNELASRSENSAKETPSKVVCLEQGERHDSRLVPFGEKSHKRCIEDAYHPNDKK